jgi:hypothetical protein
MFNNNSKSCVFGSYMLALLGFKEANGWRRTHARNKSTCKVVIFNNLSLDGQTTNK